MSKSMKKMLLLAALQTAKGVPAVPTAATDAVLCRALTPEPISGEQVERNLIRPFKGNSGKLVVGEHRKLTFEVEFAGSGTPGVAPAWGKLLEGCGFSVTITDDESVEYQVVSEGEPLLTLHCILDKTLFILTDAKGTVSFDINAKTIPVAKFEFIGAYSAPTELQTMPTNVDYRRFTQPQTVGKKNTPVFTFHGLTACMSTFTLALANALAWSEMVNCAGAESPDRTPTGTTVLELASADTKNWAEVVRKGETGACQLVHGTNPGNIIQIDMPNILCGIPTLSDENSKAMISLPFDINPLEGDDELTITFK